LYAISERSIRAHVKRGTPALNPAPPPLQRDATTYELALADVFINNGAITITQANITDTRFNTVLCGIATGLIQQIDFSVITAQFNAFFAEYKPRIQADYSKWVADITFHFESFLAWLESYRGQVIGDFAALAEIIRGILDDEIASKLLLMIKDLQSNVPSAIIGMVEHSLSRYPVCTLYSTENAAGMGGVAMGGAGGENLKSIPAVFELNAHDSVTVTTIAKFAEYTEMHKISETMFSFTAQSGAQSLLLTLN